MSGEAGRRFRVYVGVTTNTIVYDPNKYITDVDFPNAAAEIDVTGLGNSNKVYDTDLAETVITLTGNDMGGAATGTMYADHTPRELFYYSGTYYLIGTTAYLWISPDGAHTTSGKRISGAFKVMSYDLTAAVGGKRGFKATLRAAEDLSYLAFTT